MSVRTQQRQQARRNRKSPTSGRKTLYWHYFVVATLLLLATFGALAASNTIHSSTPKVEAVPTLAQPSPPPVQKPATVHKPETYLELDLSQGKGLFTAWRIVPSDDEAILNTGKLKLASDLHQGDHVRMSDGLIALVTKSEKYVERHPENINKPLHNGNVAERVIGWSKHITDTLLYVYTSDDLIKTTPEHPFFVHNKGWIKAGHLQQDDQIETSSTQLVPVLRTQLHHERQAVYNLDVENTHTFFVGKDKLLVHNGDCVPSLSEAKDLLRRWAKDPDDGTRATLVRRHFDKHGDEVGADDIWDYMRQAQKANRSVKGPGKPIDGPTPDTMGYKLSGGRYIHVAPSGIVSYGSR